MINNLYYHIGLILIIGHLKNTEAHFEKYYKNVRFKGKVKKNP